MPTATQERIAGWVSCSSARCPGYTQRPVEVVRERVAFTYHDLGALPSDPVPATAIERETVRVVQEDGACELCGRPLMWTDLARPEYPEVAGGALDLLNLNQQGQVNDLKIDGLTRDKELAEMRAQLAEMGAELQRRRGGRPPKDTDAA
jgi:hypothetical protein